MHKEIILLQQSSQNNPNIGWEELFKQFFILVIKSPVALATLVLSAGLGYGISFVIFDYRRSDVRKSHYLLHPVVGLGYSAIIFTILNSDLLSKNMNYSDMAGRMPLTLLISFIIAFVIIIIVSIIREIKN